MQMRESVQYAFDYPDASREYVRMHAQEMDEAVMKAHIDLYVNEYSLSLGEKGREAVQKITGGSGKVILPTKARFKNDDNHHSFSRTRISSSESLATCFR